MTTDTTEKGLESLICTYLTGQPSGGAEPLTVRERPAEYGVGWSHGDSHDYDREYCVDIVQLSEFLHATQPQAAAALNLGDDNNTRRKFLARLQGEITKRGTTAVLRNGIKHGPHQIDLFYGAPSPGNDSAESLYGLNRFTVTRQLRYSNDNAQLALDLGLFINGLPIITFELKNSLKKTDGGRRHQPVQGHPQPPGAAVRNGAVPGPLRGGRPRGLVLHPPAEQAVLVPPF